MSWLAQYNIFVWNSLEVKRLFISMWFPYLGGFQVVPDEFTCRVEIKYKLADEAFFASMRFLFRAVVRIRIGAFQQEFLKYINTKESIFFQLTDVDSNFHKTQRIVRRDRWLNDYVTKRNGRRWAQHWSAGIHGDTSCVLLTQRVVAGGHRICESCRYSGWMFDNPTMKLSKRLAACQTQHHKFSPDQPQRNKALTTAQSRASWVSWEFSGVVIVTTIYVF